MYPTTYSKFNASSTSIPSATSPKIVCLPAKWSRSSPRKVKKNCSDGGGGGGGGNKEETGMIIIKLIMTAEMIAHIYI